MPRAAMLRAIRPQWRDRDSPAAKAALRERPVNFPASQASLGSFVPAPE